MAKKSDALQLFGGKHRELAEAVGVTTQAVYQWPEDLPRRIEDRVIAAAARRGISLDSFIAGEPPAGEKAAAV